MVIWSDPAKADLRSIHDFIAHDSQHYAKKVTQDIVAKTNTLGELPRVGRVVPELSNEAIRELSLYSYRILYEIKEHGVFVLAVIHKRRDLQPEMLER
ncbi:type II toxin-antitoxin system RelE/ParE family toxin [Thiohalomonas denitrificans]|uniref:type II toxin-antitoxin system RelE/ParE family toxin n=1 Tax=Thiohalomonas denitrificans TaxID=415747 RepID=UPI0026E94CC8|nr:type II toxin-antitoxin system RelE/ParE family toxin [Thiohalomonas denitrificans]